MTALPDAVVIFGVSGFIGRNLIDALYGEVPRLIGVNTSGNAVQGCGEVVRADCLNDIRGLPPETVVINVAAFRYDAAKFRREQSAILQANANIATSAYRFCSERRIREFRLASSVAVYPAEWDVLDDERPLDFNLPPHEGEAAYAWSKRFSEICADLHRSLYGIHTLTFRLTNAYGPYDSTDLAAAHVAPAFVMRALDPGDTFEIRGNPNAERDFIFSGDVARTLLASLRHRGEHTAYNLAAGKSVGIRELAEAAIRASGNQKNIVSSETVAGGVATRRASASKLFSDFELPAFRGLDEGLAETMEWYRNGRL